MTGKTMRMIAAAGLLSIAGAALAAEYNREHEGDIAVDQAPAKVQQALQDQAQGAALTKMTRISRGKSVMFEGGWRVDGGDHEATVTKDGALMESESTIDPEQAPEAVRAAAKKRFGDAEGLVFEKKTVFIYSVEHKGGDQGGEQEIEVLPDGRSYHAEGDEMREREEIEGHEREDDHEHDGEEGEEDDD